ncbi:MULTISPECIES: alpha/beta fold hydrolase [unclassified Streptomyces]|uniref:alpha/beta fold hydrolase n=1 Tax=unclassified Streptomyces TaxID=2593676 RepID=UPI00403C69C0
MPTPTSQAAADAFLARLDRRTQDRDTAATDQTIGAQVTALARWEQSGANTGRAGIDRPVLVVNGDDTMIPTISSFHLADQLPDAERSIYPDSGPGALFQHHELFVRQALDFLRN